MRTSNEVNEIAKALSAAQKEMKPAYKESTNPHFKSRYSSICSIWESIRIPLTSNGLTVWQDVTTQEKTVSVDTRIVHSSGQWVEFGPLCIPVSQFSAQAYGSAISYAKRYALSAALGVVSTDDDDDGESLMKPFRDEKPLEPLSSKPSFVTKSQADQLENMIAPDDMEYRTKLLEFYKIKSFADLPSERYLGAVDAITKHNKVLAEQEMKKKNDELPF